MDTFLLTTGVTLLGVIFSVFAFAYICKKFDDANSDSNNSETSNQNVDAMKEAIEQEIYEVENSALDELFKNIRNNPQSIHILDSPSIKAVLKNRPEMQKKVEEFKKELKSNPYNANITRDDAIMLTKIDGIFDHLAKHGLTEEIRSQAKKVKNLNYEFKNYIDSGDQEAMQQVATSIESETKYLMAMVTRHNINEGIIDEEDIPPELLKLMDSELNKKNANKSYGKLGASLDFDMPAFGKFNLDDM